MVTIPQHLIKCIMMCIFCITVGSSLQVHGRRIGTAWIELMDGMPENWLDCIYINLPIVSLVKHLNLCMIIVKFMCRKLEGTSVSGVLRNSVWHGKTFLHQTAYIIMSSVTLLSWPMDLILQLCIVKCLKIEYAVCQHHLKRLGNLVLTNTFNSKFFHKELSILMLNH